MYNAKYYGWGREMAAGNGNFSWTSELGVGQMKINGNEGAGKKKNKGGGRKLH